MYVRVRVRVRVRCRVRLLEQKRARKNITVYNRKSILISQSIINRQVLKTIES